MKIIKTLFVILLLNVMFISCENETINDEIGIENIDLDAVEDEDEVTDPNG